MPRLAGQTAVSRGNFYTPPEGLLGTSSGTVGGVLAFREVATVNEPLRRALLRARLREGDVAARLDVDPKTVRRWLNGGAAYPPNRAATPGPRRPDQGGLWPEAGEALAG